MAAECCKDPKVARVASACMLQACEGALCIDMDIPQTIPSGLLTAIQATDDPEVSCSTAFLSCPFTSSQRPCSRVDSCKQGNMTLTACPVCLVQVEQDLVVALADCLSTGSNVPHQQLVVSQQLQTVHDSLEALSSLYLAGMPP